VLINAYLAPKMQSYLTELDEGLRARGAKLFVMQSSGGITSAALAAREPVRTILSGPAGGVVGAAQVAKTAGFTKILTFDMGGTSTDVALLSDGVLRTTSEFQILGMPVAIPMLDIHTVGAGGGSLASFDRGGAMKVGPESAGAEPGPICYGKGEKPTVTDANLVLGRIEPDGFLGGGMRLDPDRAREFMARAMGKMSTVERFAEGIVRVVDANMVQALRKISVEQGYDPRDFVLLSFGGAGPLHACALARALRIPKVLVPNMPGALSAYGILISDVVRDFSRTVMLNPGDERLVARFHHLHRQRYGYSDERRTIEIVNVRVRKTSATLRTETKPETPKPGTGAHAIVRSKQIYCEGAWRNGTVYERAKLRPGDSFTGPAVVVEYSATTFVEPGAQVLVDAFRNLVIEV
jgi:N-methylhydantoinase A